jgi:Mn2+/Fe2+ NRAMP family transporter
MLNETFGWHASLDQKWGRGRRFYESMILLTVIAALAGLLGAPPIKVLFVASIIGGVGTPISLIVMLLVARSRSIMGRHPIGRPLAAAGWGVAGIVIAATGAYFASLFWQ